MVRRLLIAIALLVVAPMLHALQSEAPEPPPIREPEPLPPKVTDPDDELEPQVIIRREEGQRVEEYVSGGQVYMIRIVPDVGPPYYLIDTTGDGNFNERFSVDQFDRVRPPHWKIVEW
jgi:hypothetical protein